MAAPTIKTVSFLSPDATVKPESGRSDLKVTLADGSLSSFAAATPDQPGFWTGKGQAAHYFSNPILFVSRLDTETTRVAIDAMAHEMGGYWLRYYHCRDAVAAAAKGKAPRPKSPGLGTASFRDASPHASPDHCSAVVEAVLKDGREFSILASTPTWFAEAFRKLGLRYYYGPAVLFVRKMDNAIVRKAVREMAERGDTWLCRYDSPRTTLPQVLSDFRARHP